MADNQTGQEKTEQATPKRLQESRDKGEVARSRELNTVMVMFGSALAFLMLGESMIKEFSEFLTDRLSLQRELVFDKALLLRYLMDSILTIVMILLPLFIIVFLVAFLGPLSMSGWVFSIGSLKFNLEKIDPIKGIKRVFSVSGLVELIKALLKFILIASLSALAIFIYQNDIFELGGQDALVALSNSAYIFGVAFLSLNLALLVIAGIDVPFQLWQHAKKLKMTRQEVKDELKQTDGNPEVKGKVKQIQRAIAQRRMMEDVQNADVVITNPTHYSIALKYEEDKSSAPIVTAKGTDLVALKMRDIARSKDIVIFTAPPLARALYFSTKLGQQIPEGLYIAVAKVLAYVYQLKLSEAGSVVEPEMPDEFEIPSELQHE